MIEINIGNKNLTSILLCKVPWSAAVWAKPPGYFYVGEGSLCQLSYNYNLLGDLGLELVQNFLKICLGHIPTKSLLVS